MRTTVAAAVVLGVLVLTGPPAGAGYGDVGGVAVTGVDVGVSSLQRFAMELGPDDAFWQVASSPSRILRIETDGDATELALPLPATAKPYDLTFVGDDVWFTYGDAQAWDDPAGGIGRVTPGGDVTLFDDPTDNLRGARGIAVGADGMVWAGSAYGSVLVGLDPAAPEEGFSYIDVPGRPYDLLPGPDGTLWWSGANQNADAPVSDLVGRTDLDTELSETTDPAGLLLGDGGDGGVWTSGRHQISSPGFEVTPAPAGSPTCGGGAVAPGPDGRTWVAGIVATCRLSSDGGVTTYDAPAGYAGRNAAAGPDDDLWLLVQHFEGDLQLLHVDLEPGPVTGPPDHLAANELVDSIEVSWQAPEQDGGSTTGYDLFRDGELLLELPGGQRSYDDADVIPGEVHEYRVSASNALGDGPLSDPVEAAAGGPPDAPTDVEVVGAVDGIELSWSPPADVHGFPVTLYRVYRDGSVWLTGPTTSTIDTTIANGTPHEYAVAAVNERGEGPRSPVAEATARSFSDVPPGHPFFVDVEWMAAEGIAEGTEPGPQYLPNAEVTRQAMAAFLFRLSGDDALDPLPADPTFTDVPTNHPFYAEIEWMADTASSTGYPDGTYRPAAVVTRQAMAAFLFRLSGQVALDVLPADPTFTDVVGGHPFLAEIEWMAATGISTGYPDGTYRPGADVTRQAMAAFLHRLVDGPGIAA